MSFLRLCKKISSRGGLLLLMLAVAPDVKADTFKEAFERGSNCIKNEDYEGAIQAFTLAKSLAPVGANDARINLARLYTRLARYSEAEVEYQALLVNARNRDLRHEFAKFYMEQGRFKSAMGLYANLISEEPNDKIALLYMARCLEGSEDIDSAKDYYQQVVTRFPGTEEASQAAGRLGRLSQAIDLRQKEKFFAVDPEFGAAGLGWWNLQKMPIHVYIDDGEGVRGYRQQMRTSVLKAMDAWRQASGGRIEFVLDGPDSQAEAAWREAIGEQPVLNRVAADPKDMPADPVKCGIHVHWVPDLSGAAVGLTWTNILGNYGSSLPNSSELNHAHVWLTTDCRADGQSLPEGGSNSALIESQDRLIDEVAIHEFGHALGLMHSSNPRDIMCAGIYSLNSLDLVEGRSLSSGDIGSLAEHYNQYKGTGMSEKSHGERASSGRSSTTAKGHFLQTDAGKKEGSAKYAGIISDISAGRYTESLDKLTPLLKEEPKDVVALYLRGVTAVFLHKYADAIHDYKLVMELVPGTELASRAAAGLAKIKH